jgi:NTP pyrophosphatase (non-canonical NTP hydrolase)
MDEGDHKPMSPWVPEDRPKILRRIGKTGEEAAELSAICFRIVIQGYDESDPETEVPNKESLEKEIADVYAQLDATVTDLQLDGALIDKRRAFKRRCMDEWESHFADEDPWLNDDPRGHD